MEVIKNVKTAAPLPKGLPSTSGETEIHMKNHRSTHLTHKFTFYLGEIPSTLCSPLTPCVQVSPWLQGNHEDPGTDEINRPREVTPTGFTGVIRDLMVLGEAPNQDGAEDT